MKPENDERIKRVAKLLVLAAISYMEYTIAVPMIVMVMFAVSLALVAFLFLLLPLGVPFLEGLLRSLGPIIPPKIEFHYERISLVEPFLILAFVFTVLGNIVTAALKRVGIRIELGFIKKTMLVLAFITACYLFAAIAFPLMSTEKMDVIGFCLTLGFFYIITVIVTLISLSAGFVLDLIRKLVEAKWIEPPEKAHGGR